MQPDITSQSVPVEVPGSNALCSKDKEKKMMLYLPTKTLKIVFKIVHDGLSGKEVVQQGLGYRKMKKKKMKKKKGLVNLIVL